MTAADPRAPWRVLARGRWPEDGDVGAAPGVPGFVHSDFAPTVVAVAERCLRRAYGTEPLPAGNRTAVLLVSASGDRTGAAQVRATVAAGGRVGPLFFYQSVPNSVAGHVAARWGLDGPVVCLSPTGDPWADGTAEAELLRYDGDADQALLILIEQASDGTPTEAVAVLLGEGTGQ
ncbi:beta-ketoacyl synthase chain length factor [Micromonospora auratinigra]|uniref:Beta-ketoacyl synthase, N-terminal domain n=1 Tax=Micromonospora auratinigra TaxID=261654 RepID=A0A1A8ZEB6_9ACTN|nr:beta-ketoacyl synthase chain length factor [Micromonospora auratinigra]SBT42206.1 Beta-ketoacyl synthase, N-terminal domain [Micromonospora auratinigra]